MGMRKSSKSHPLPQAFAGALVLAIMFGATPALAAAPCPNEPSRTSFSAQLPDCRVYEWVTPDSNDGELQDRGTASADGRTVEYTLNDPPTTANSSSPVNIVLARRGPDGWSSTSTSPPLVAPVGGFWSEQTLSVSQDFSETLFLSDQPYEGSASPPGFYNLFVQHADGTILPLTTTGTQESPTTGVWASPDFTHLFYIDTTPQLASDPSAPKTMYEWVDGELRLLGIEPGPGQVPMHEGVALAGTQPTSNDGEYALFTIGNRFLSNVSPGNQLYLREHGKETVVITRSQRTVEPETSEPPVPTPVGISGDGSRVLFISPGKLTNDAVGGGDLYSYDVATGILSDLTAESDPGIAAGVSRVLGFTNDMSYVYFTAGGLLTPGAVAGKQNLYVLHEGTVRFVADEVESPPAGLYRPGPESSLGQFYVTPDGRHVAFASKAGLTGFDNTNPHTGAPEAEVFEYTYGEGVTCASCRPSGAAPTGSAALAFGTSEWALNGTTWTLSNDGSRMFFQSTDAILPQATNGLQNVYEYENGEVHLISPGDSDYPATLIAGSASGEDVFFIDRGELVTHGSGLLPAIYDARVGAIEPASAQECNGEDCQGAPSVAPVFGSPSSTALSGSGNLTLPAPVTAKPVTKKIVKCGKGKKLKRGKCVKVKSKKKAKQAKRSSIRKGAK